MKTKDIAIYAVTEKGKIVTNQIAWNDFLRKNYRINGNFLLFNSWWFKISLDSRIDAYLALGPAFVRAVYYRAKYNLRFTEETIYFFKKTLKVAEGYYYNEAKAAKFWDSRSKKKGYKSFDEVLRELSYRITRN